MDEAHMNAHKRIGISLASFFHPFWYIPGLGEWWPRMWTRWSVKTAREAGYGFLQALPCRGSEVLMPGGSLPVKYLEPAWRGGDGEGHGSLWQVLCRRKDPTGPRIEDWLFFENPRKLRKSWERQTDRVREAAVILHDHYEFVVHARIVEVSHGVSHGGFPEMHKRLLEVSPGLWLTPEQILELDRPAPDGLVLDTWHLRRKPRDDEEYRRAYQMFGIEPGEAQVTYVPCSFQNPLGWWKESLPILLPHTKLIHVQPRRDDGGEELRKFIRSEPTELGSIIARARLHGYEGDFVVEASLGAFGTPGKIREMVTGMHGAVLDLITAPLGQFED